MDTNQSGNVYEKDTVGPERLEDRMETICLEEVQADRFSEQRDWGDERIVGFYLEKSIVRISS
jgi:hypothetical protein